LDIAETAKAKSLKWLVLPSEIEPHSSTVKVPMARSWSTSFVDPIVLPDDRKLLTLKDAADYVPRRNLNCRMADGD